MKRTPLRRFRHLFPLLAVAVILLLPTLAPAVDVLTHHNDIARTGQNLQETALTTSNVNVNNFGKLYARTVDGQIWAQPLYVSNLSIQGATHNVVYVATMHNSVYAFDADDPNASTALWQVNLGPSVPATDICPTCGYVDISNEIGILSTPVIDTGAGTIYVVAKNKHSDGTYHFMLHALDLLTGAEKLGGPVEITGQVPGTGVGSSNGQVAFNALQHLQRPGLLLLNGVVYVAFGSVGDIGPYHGWVFAYDTTGTGLQLVDIFNTTPNGSDGGTWQSGEGLTADGSGNIYFMTGNGSFTANTGGSDYGDSFIKLTSAPFTVLDYFTPFNQATLDRNDTDLGSGGPLLLPGGYLAGMGKDSILRLVDTSNMGGFNSTTNNDVQEFTAVSGGTANSPNSIFWNSPNNGAVIYLWGQNDFLKAYKFNGSSFTTTPVLQGTVRETAGYSNSVPLSLSANGNQTGTGIVWGSAAYNQNANHQVTAGIVRAFDATTLTELWNSKQNALRDDVGNYAKFCPPTVANGKVFVSTLSNQLVVYGLNPPPVGQLPPPWQAQDIGSVGLSGSSSYANGVFTVSASGSDIYGTADSFRYTYQSLNGDGQIIARVATLQNTNVYAKGGVMIRETLAANSIQATVDVTPGNGAEFSRRTSTGGTTTTTTMAGITAPYWVKLVRSGNSFSAYISPDGNTWTQIGASATISMASSVYVGLAVTSHANATVTTATFDNVSVPGSSAAPTVAITAPANNATFNAPANITITATATAGTGATVQQVDFFNGTTLIGTATASPYSVTWNNVGAGNYSLTARVTDTLNAMATSTPVSISVVTSGLPTPWLTQDIGSVGVAGSAAFASGVFTLRGSGSDISSTADSFRFVYQTLNGDGTIVARVVSLQNTNTRAKGGVMIRETLAANSRHAMMDVTPGHGAEFSRRTSTGGTTTSTTVAKITAPYWVRLVRSGNTLTGSVSSDGVNWVQVGSTTIAMASSVYVGLIDCSHNNTKLCTATVDGVSVTGGSASPSVAITTPANNASFTAPANITITATATAGSGATVQKVDFYAGANLVGTATASPYSVTWNNVAAGNYSLTAVVTDTLGATATSAAVQISVTSSGLPAPWASQDIGSVGVAGSASFLNGVFTLRGSGSDIWSTADGFRFVYKQMTGDGQIVARVASLQNTSTYAKGGVMMRQSLTANSIHAMMDVTPGNGAEFSRRTTTGGSTSATIRSGITAPYWVRLVRSGNTFTGSISTDGVTWSQVGTSTISMPTTIYVGLIVNSHNNSVLCTTTIDGVQ